MIDKAKQSIVLEYGVDNIFEYWFMDDFTTVAAYLEDGGDLLHIDKKGIETSLYRDDFYCLSEKKAYTAESLYAKFNIVEIGRPN